MNDVPLKYPYKGEIRWAFLRWADIEDRHNPGFVYLRRLRVAQTPWMSIYLHWIYKTDKGQDPHDHPFNFRSIVLRGGYSERLWRVVRGHSRSQHPFERRWPRFTSHKMTQRYAHRIERIAPGTVTLVLVGRKRGTWGFYGESGFVHWKDYDRSDEDALA